MTGTVHTRKDGSLGWLVIDRPERRNALSNAMWEALPEAVASLDADPAIRAIILRGAGQDAFAAGADITELDAMGRDHAALAAFEERFERAQTSIETASKPVIAAIRGPCMGGGLALALCCDIRISATDGRFAIPAARLGLGYAAPAVARLVRAAGAANAFTILATAAPVDAGTAQRMGLIGDIVEDEDVFGYAARTAGTIAANAPLTIRAAKATIRALTPCSTTLQDAEALIARCADSADFAEGRRAFVERRTPVFSGT